MIQDSRFGRPERFSQGVEKEKMDTRILPASEADGLPRGPLHGPKGHRPPVHPEARRVTSLPRGPLNGPKGHESPVTSCKPFSFTLLSKNASANHLESHSCKNKGLKVPCFHTLTKKGVGEGDLFASAHESPITNHGPRARYASPDSRRDGPPVTILLSPAPFIFRLRSAASG